MVINKSGTEVEVEFYKWIEGQWGALAGNWELGSQDALRASDQQHSRSLASAG